MNAAQEYISLSIFKKQLITKKGETMSKDTYIRIRLTFEEKRMIKEEAKRNKTNMSDFILTATRNTIAKGGK